MTALQRESEHGLLESGEHFPRPFGQYLLLENFARGGMGEVYLAKLGGIVGLEKYCVLKKLRTELTRDREYVTRFIDEARVVVTLNHANICHVFDVGRVTEEYYLAMEYISGRDVRTLQDRARARNKPLPPATVMHLVCEVLEALDYAHRRNHPMTGEPLNLVHRDVSPQNILVSFEGEVKLIDFGLAASRLKVERTQPNIVMGKMAYMAPEQARGDAIDSRADLFAVGVLCYELLSGERFYEGMTANDIWQVAGRGAFMPGRWRDLDPDVAKILSRALHPDQHKRYPTCGDFREALAGHLHWRFPGTGVRSLRDVVSDLFSDEIAREREMLARFGTVTVASFRTTLEVTKSQSVTLVGSSPGPLAEGGRGAGNAARVVRREPRRGDDDIEPMPSDAVLERLSQPSRPLPGDSGSGAVPGADSGADGDPDAATLLQHTTYDSLSGDADSDQHTDLMRVQGGAPSSGETTTPTPSKRGGQSTRTASDPRRPVARAGFMHSLANHVDPERSTPARTRLAAAALVLGLVGLLSIAAGIGALIGHHRTSPTVNATAEPARAPAASAPTPAPVPEPAAPPREPPRAERRPARAVRPAPTEEPRDVDAADERERQLVERAERKFGSKLPARVATARRAVTTAPRGEGRQRALDALEVAITQVPIAAATAHSSEAEPRAAPTPPPIAAAPVPTQPAPPPQAPAAKAALPNWRDWTRAEVRAQVNRHHATCPCMNKLLPQLVSYVSHPDDMPEFKLAVARCVVECNAGK